MITAVSVTKRYGARTALDAVSFGADRSITVFLNRMAPAKRRHFGSRLGKCGRRGRIDIGRKGSAAATLGVPPHVPGVYGRLTVREHITYFGALRGMRGARLEARVTELVDQLELSAAADSRRGPSRRARP